MTMTPVSDLDDDPRLQQCVRFAFGSQDCCVLPSQQLCSLIVGESGTGFWLASR
jgi:hypothetical protein